MSGITVLLIVMLSFTRDNIMKNFTYICFYKGRQITVQAITSYEAQQAAAKQFKAKKSYDVSVFLADKPVDAAVL
jgi:hypothetical protein